MFTHSIRGVECAREVRAAWRALFLNDSEGAGDGGKIRYNTDNYIHTHNDNDDWRSTTTRQPVQTHTTMSSNAREVMSEAELEDVRRLALCRSHDCEFDDNCLRLQVQSRMRHGK